MKFDIEATSSEMLAAIKSVAKDNWGEIKNKSQVFIKNRRERLELIGSLRIEGDITEEKFLSRMEDEKVILEAELNAVAVLSKAVAQKAANAAMEVLEKAIRLAISTL